jgi:hypothetical protein
MLPRDHDGCQSAWTGDARFVRVARGLGTLSILLGLAAVVSWAIMVIAVMSLGGARLATQGPIDWAGGAHGDGQAVVGA